MLWECGLHTLIHTFLFETKLQYLGLSLENAEFLSPLSFVVFLLAVTSPLCRSGTPESKITLPRAESGTALAPILTQRSICHVIVPIYVQLASLAAHEGMQSGRGECHDRSTDQFVSHPLLWVDHH